MLSLTLAGCKDQQLAADLGPSKGVLKVAGDSGPDVGLFPGQSTYLRVIYARPDGGALPGRQVRFAIFDDPGGSTLSADSAVTGTSGEAAVKLSAGANTSRFKVRASAPGGETVTFNIVVSNAAKGKVLVKSSYEGAVPLLKLVKVTYYLYLKLVCGTPDPVSPKGYQREPVATALDQAVVFGALPLNEDHTLFAVATDDTGRARAAGCAGLSRDTLRSDRTLTLTLLLEDLRPRVKGSYVLTSRLTIPGTSVSGQSWPRPMARALYPWADLADCPNDPAQIMLDCILDALDSGDPVDCQVTAPSARTRALMAERGMLAGACRSDETERGTSSLDRKLRQSMADSGSPVMALLPKLEPTARVALKVLTLSSRLDLQELDDDGAAVASHRLESLSFSVGTAQALYKAQEVGLARVLASPVKATVSELKVPGYSWQLTLARHALSLRLGLVSRAALGKLVLTPAGLPPKSSDLVTSLASLVQGTSGGKTLTGCAAIEARACTAARLGSGCLGSACAAGLAAMARQLDAGFQSLDVHAGDDITLSGEVGMTDEDGDLKPDSLGSPSTPGVWSAWLRLADEQVQPSESTFSGKRGQIK